MSRNPVASQPVADEGLVENGIHLEGYRVLRSIGEGAMGQVFLAQDLALGRRVALKFLRVELLGAGSAEVLLEEARTTARFNHPHIVTVHAVGVHEGRPYLVLEHIDGESLRQRLLRERPGPNEALRICRAIAEAVAEAHRHGVVHADLKPENVLLPRDGRVRVVDFGLARHVGAAHGAASGTPAYMAPERWHGHPPSPAIDMWALGIIAWELLEGRRPIEDARLASFAFAPRPVAPSPLLSELEGGPLLHACLALDPAQRPSAEEVARALQEVLNARLSHATDRVPFRGLRAFTEAEAEDFFGREVEVDAFVERMRHEPLIPLVGPSGIGKSSFLQAGVFARLRQMDHWTVLQARPGPRPLARLATLLTAGLRDEASPDEVAAVLAARPGDIVRLLRRRGELRGGNVLLVFDAFEEVFTLASREEASQVAACLAAALDANDPWRIVVALRDDYLGAYCSLAPLQQSLRAVFVLARLTQTALQEAVAGPLRRVGYSVDVPTLVSRLVADVQAQPAGLPLLQFACMALWERRDVAARKLLTSVYDALGGVGGALASHAQQLLLQLPTNEVHATRALLVRLVTAEGTRRPRPQVELMEDLGEVGTRVLEKLLANRLVVVTREPQTDEAFIELAHESLAATWPDLARWLGETREERVLVQQLEQAAQLWEQRGRPDEETWSDTALRQALQRVEAWRIHLPTRPRAFLEAGRQRALRRAWRRKGLMAAAVAGLTLVSLGAVLSALAFREKQLEAVRQQDLIRLASADIGEFELVLEPHDFDAEQQRWLRAREDVDLEWELLPAKGTHDPSEASPYPALELRRSQRRREPGGILREQVEAPSRPAWLVVHRGDCPASVMRLERLPGHQERGRSSLEVIRIPVPTCAASRAGSVVIPPGPYWRPGDEEEATVEQLVEVARFAIDRTEVTNGQFHLFQEEVLVKTAHERELPPDHPIFTRTLEPTSPVTGLDALTSEAFCRFMGKTLPTMDEWRKAFRGGLALDEEGTVLNPAPRRKTVWLEPKREPPANIMGEDPYPGVAPVGAFPEDVSPYGLLDMAGNVAEWTETTATSGRFRTLRMLAGGRWDSPVELGHHEVAWANHLPQRRFDFAIGVRCVERPYGSFSRGAGAGPPRAH
ncbi:bifunctional serine/threonine-protein kinase/formylglycine-generating enzyme family protein [Myxococcus sp. SDU36]|uniref:bifunctional serine/threonine-protein kinase/formylglycine-generating enzyme family protein n=1 Tax=Myxococcus sp. SDU36 TaxID=2831967 RepID=UPI002543EF24|nr:bifunctional serine/threonine-protein kinase/formylglycine-generating enzyme family protein [Myxococcus sp. SDU36]WIG94091.1 protein kinase [Myxococcus sp. SDU36]